MAKSLDNIGNIETKENFNEKSKEHLRNRRAINTYFFRCFLGFWELIEVIKYFIE